MVDVGCKVKIKPNTKAWDRAPESLRDDFGVVYARVLDKRSGERFRVRFSQECHYRTDVLIDAQSLKVLGEMDDLGEVKRLCISWGANPFGSWWAEAPYV